MGEIIRAAAIAGTHQLRRARPRPPAAPADVHGDEALTPVEAVAQIAPPAVELEVAMLQARLQARETLAEQAQRDQAEAAAEQARQLADAFDEAEHRGFAAGEEKGGLAAQALVREQVERLAAAAATLADARQAVLDDAEDMIVEIAYAALCRMLGDTLAERGAIVELVRLQLQTARDPELLTVRLNPYDLDLVRVPADDGAMRIDARVALVADAGIRVGGCIVDGPTGTLDARLDIQLERLRATLLAVRGERKRSGEQP